MADYTIDLVPLAVADAISDNFGSDHIWWLVSPVTPVVPAPYVAPNLKQAGEKYDDLTTSITKFIGYRPSDEELEEFPYEIYKFLIYSLRQRDQNKRVGGTALLKRFLMGPQEIWYELYRACSRLNTLVDPESIHASYLNSLMRLLGFGNDLSDVSAVSSEEEIRRIISGAPEFWRERWLDLGIDTAIRIVTGNRFKVRDYFDFRFIIGENLITEDMENEDPYSISVQTLELFKNGVAGETQYGSVATQFFQSGSVFTVDDIGSYVIVFDDGNVPSNNGFYEIIDVDSGIAIVDSAFPSAQTSITWFQGFKNDENLTEVRVVDELTGQGAVNRNLLEKLLELQRYLSERINIVYVDFMDLFDVKGDLGMWEEVNEAGPLTGLGFDTLAVDNRVLTMTANGLAGFIKTNRSTADTWQDYQWKVKAAILSDPCTFQMFFLVQPNFDAFYVGVSYDGFGSGVLSLHSYTSFTPSKIIDLPLPNLNPETFWTYTIEAFRTETGVSIRVYVDGNLKIKEDVVSSFYAGNVGYIVVSSSSVKIAETELWQYPLDIVRVGPNP